MRKYRRILFGAFVALVGLGYYLCLPDQLFSDPYSTVLESSSGHLLSATIAPDGQWRFPESDSLPEKFTTALIAFEDKRFFNHPGVDILSLGRALKQNISEGKTVSGGSTISMQVIRLSRNQKSRTLFEKAIEATLATRLELRYSKNEILSLYAAHAPFGGNVVGLEAACWRYFGVEPRNLSWAEAALLAVLPNAPSLIHPGKNRNLLKAKRDRLLDKLKSMGKIDEFTCMLAKEEQVPEQPKPLPRLARHLLLRMASEHLSQQKLRSTIDIDLQQQVESVVQHQHNTLSQMNISNAAALVVDVKTGYVLAYIGNIISDDAEQGGDVDIIASPRSTGSILKPFLYAAMLEEGKILPKTLLPDVPVIINGFAPKNFSRSYDGALGADQALIRSLNVPAVHMLKDYRNEKFYSLLQEVGITTLNKSPEHYGLSLILGGAEGTLWDITGAYASLARSLQNYSNRSGDLRYDKTDFRSPAYFNTRHDPKPERNQRLSAASIWLTFEALKELTRPGEESGWKHFSSAKPIAWKTGTSYGFRDGWAVGVNADFAVGVWVGNADGEGRPGLTGIDAAAPVLFDIFSRLPGNKWFHQPYPEMFQVVTCKKSGHRRTSLCTETDTVWVAKKGLETPPCPYHKTIHLTADAKFRVHSECAAVAQMKHFRWFVLPPVQEYYYKAKNLSYKSVPPYRKDCAPTTAVSTMDMIYPKQNARLFLPRDIDGKPGSSIFELAHRDPKSEVHWHLDGQYIGSTKRSHYLALQPTEGRHTLTLVDANGESIERRFEVICKM